MNNIIKNALAKSIGVNLIQHNKNVSIVAKYIANKIILIKEDDIMYAIEIGALLHDIGKMTKEFQELLKKNKKTNNKFQHNEIGWAFLNKYLNINYKEFIVNSIYWHHGIINKMNTHYCDDILEKISDENIQMFKEIVIELLDDLYLNSDDIAENINVLSPKYIKNNDINSDYNHKFSLIRTCIISADRIVSNLEEYNKNLIVDDNNISLLIDHIINNILLKTNNVIINEENSVNYDLQRFNTQLDIVKKCKSTNVIKAPAGFGKSLVGLMWGLSKKEKLMWICPRNVVAESVYDSIIEELKTLNLNNVSIELYLTGNVVKKNHSNNSEFNSDIIVTNIDNFISPTFNDTISHRLFLIYSTNVVFDEYHEFVSSDAYFAAFINIMKIRHQYTESKSLLLSATPVNIHKLWDSMGKQTNILPDIEHHYPAIHSKKYLINILNEFKYDQSNQNSDLVIFNSIAESQYYKSRISNSQLYHSEFNSQSKKNKYKYLMDNYGKHSKRQIKEETIVSTLIAQASFNISFLNGYESCLSPQATLQRLGRIERFDDYDENPSFTTFKPRDRKSKKPTHSRGEKSVIEIFYDNILMNLWFEELSKYNDNKLTLDEFYVIYNKHLIEYDDKLKKLYNKKYRESLFCLSEIYPIKYKNANKDNIIITAGSNKLRSNGTEIYFIVQKYDNDKEYVGLFSTAIYRNIEQDFNESGDMLRKIIGSMKTIMKTDQTEYDYSEILSNKKYITIDEIRRHAKKSNTPYIRYDKVYHPDYGLITKDNLNNIN